MMFRALKYLKVPTVMVRFPNESRELSRSGQPWHRIERLEHIVGWFDHWLMGVPKPEGVRLTTEFRLEAPTLSLDQLLQMARRRASATLGESAI